MYEYAKIQRKILLEDALAMIFLLILVCYVAHSAKHHSYLLADIKIRVKFDNIHMTQCAKMIVGFMANVGNVFIKRLQTFFFLIFPRYLRF